jgi:hypothetical protein
MKTRLLLPLVPFLVVAQIFAAPPAAPLAQPGPALTALDAKFGSHWAFKGPVLSFKADAPLTEEVWKEIEATGAKNIYVGRKGIDDAALVRFAKLQPEGLSIDNSSLTEAGLAVLKDMKQLKSLGLSHALALKGPGLAAIANHPALTSVSVGGTGIGDPAMAPIASIKQLTRLGLNHDQITDAGFAALANHPALETLMYSPQMTPRLTDESLKTVATLKALRELTINDTVLTYDGGLRLLKQLPNLQKLTLGKVGLSEADLAKLKTDLPKVDIKFTPAPEDAVAKWQQQFEKMKSASVKK